MLKVRKLQPNNTVATKCIDLCNKALNAKKEEELAEKRKLEAQKKEEK